MFRFVITLVFLVLAGAYARPGWKHLGFETQEEYYKFLEKTFNISGLTGIRPVNNLDYLTSTANPNNKNWLIINDQVDHSVKNMREDKTTKRLMYPDINETRTASIKIIKSVLAICAVLLIVCALTTCLNAPIQGQFSNANVRTPTVIAGNSSNVRPPAALSATTPPLYTIEDLPNYNDVDHLPSYEDAIKSVVTCKNY